LQKACAAHPGAKRAVVQQCCVQVVLLCQWRVALTIRSWA
jgi:hypothetical protein